jgi:hypothetical protein
MKIESPMLNVVLPSAAPAATVGRLHIGPRRHSWRGMFPLSPHVCLIAAVALAGWPTIGRAGNLMVNYQASETIGWGAIKTVVSDPRSPQAFTDGTNDGRTYQISLLPFGQDAKVPDPVYENKPANTTINFDKVLTKGFGAGYAFNYVGGFTGQNEFNIQSYSVFASNGGGIGADFYVVYNPGKGDPVINGNLHWIQVVQDNWAQGQGNTTGKGENLVDRPGGAASPYYDTQVKGGIVPAGITKIDGNQVFNFYDNVGRPSAELAEYKFQKPIEWMAEDFLVSDTGKRNDKNQEIVDVYGGIEWGWQVTLKAGGAPEPTSFVLAAMGIPVALVLFRPRRSRARSAKAQTS